MVAMVSGLILLLQGANLTFLGRREPEIYGSTTPAELDAILRRHAHDHAYQLEIFYTNIEGEAINRIYQAVDEGCLPCRPRRPMSEVDAVDGSSTGT
jgi:3-dehydroquinate dehydratase